MSKTKTLMFEKNIGRKKQFLLIYKKITKIKFNFNENLNYPKETYAWFMFKIVIVNLDATVEEEKYNN